MTLHAAAPYTTASLAAGDDRFLPRRPGVAEIERMFPSPITAGKGNMAIEGGVSVVAGPGMGKTSLLAQLAARLDAERGLITALVAFPPLDQYQNEPGFYPFLGELVHRTRDALLQSGRVQQDPSGPMAQTLSTEPPWDGETPGTMTPRGFERYVGMLATAANHTAGVCLLFDDVDQVNQAPWKGPFISALRFVFQASAHITPIYGLWTLFGDESLPGSNYFRNVTRPVFLEPLGGEPDNARSALMTMGLPLLPDEVQHAISSLVGGHPLLLHQTMAHVQAVLPSPESAQQLTALNLEAAWGQKHVQAQIAFAAQTIARTPGLAPALKSLGHRALPWSQVPRGLVASGFVDRGPNDLAVLPERVAQALALMI